MKQFNKICGVGTLIALALIFFPNWIQDLKVFVFTSNKHFYGFPPISFIVLSVILILLIYICYKLNQLIAISRKKKIPA